MDGASPSLPISSETVAASKAIHRRTAGRKPKYDWDEFVSALMER
jgi:hypothetical protein